MAKQDINTGAYEGDYRLPIDTVYEAIVKVESNFTELYTDVNGLLETVTIEFEFASESAQLPTNLGAVRLHSFADCFIEFGDSSVTADGTKSIYFAAGTEIFGVPTGATHIAVKSAGEIGALNITALDEYYRGSLTTNAVISYAGGSSSVELPSGTKVRLFAMTDCYIAFGTSLVDASNGTFFEAGTEILSVPTGATHIAAKRYTINGGLYISGIE